MKIICPKCGEVKQYSSGVYVSYKLILDERKKIVGCTEDYRIKQGKARCLKCGRMVKLIEQESEND